MCHCPRQCSPLWLTGPQPLALDLTCPLLEHPTWGAGAPVTTGRPLACQHCPMPTCHSHWCSCCLPVFARARLEHTAGQVALGNCHALSRLSSAFSSAIPLPFLGAPLVRGAAFAYYDSRTTALSMSNRRATRQLLFGMRMLYSCICSCRYFATAEYSAVLAVKEPVSKSGSGRGNQGAATAASCTWPGHMHGAALGSSGQTGASHRCRKRPWLLVVSLRLTLEVVLMPLRPPLWGKGPCCANTLS